MDSLSTDPAECFSDDQDESKTAALASGRRTSHTGKQSSLGYGLGVVLHHLRPFIPFFLISILVVVLIYLLQAIIYGGPFTDPHFFIKFNERWPRPEQVLTTPAEPLSPVPATPEHHYPLDGPAVNGTLG
ncbi:hypothetical protein NHX12_011808 [Muraenolepis orangiensis]|uniref:Uncharacterized protein n=1 Tax=Muraenolepis orangiensis TaxID=630683 RepID=A0A9Q0DFU9_9TELE|nr:hypothetical protein NHX12_011808 [Muraenolepis orangiensis]